MLNPKVVMRAMETEVCPNGSRKGVLMSMREFQTRLARRFARDERGVAAVEFAFIAPLLIVLFVGTMELSAAASASRKLSRVSSTLSDLVTQNQTLTTTDLENIMNASSKIMYPFTDDLKITLTGITIASGAAKVEWSRARNATAPAKGTNYTVPTKIRKDGTFLVAAKVEMSYAPAFGWPSINGLRISFSRSPIAMDEEIFLRPRIGSNVTVN